MAKKLYTMELGEIYGVNADLSILRVPGGWIFAVYSRSDASHSTTFVPFNNEFQEARAEIKF